MTFQVQGVVLVDRGTRSGGGDSRGRPRSQSLRALTAGQGRSTVPVVHIKRRLKLGLGLGQS